MQTYLQAEVNIGGVFNLHMFQRDNIQYLFIARWLHTRAGGRAVGSGSTRISELLYTREEIFIMVIDEELTRRCFSTPSSSLALKCLLSVQIRVCMLPI